MRHRIYVPGVALEGEVTIAGEEFHHAVRVVRVHEGEPVEIFDGKGLAAAAVVQSLDRESATLRIVEPIDSREMKVQLHLAMAIIQLDKFELVLQKATELGAASILPLVTDRAEVRPERYRGKHERWEKIVFEAVKQSGRSVIPQLFEPAKFDDAVVGEGDRVVFDADMEPSRTAGSTAPATLFVGPEGGWSGRELDLARENGCCFRRLGTRRLRAETAAIVALATEGARRRELD